MNGLLSNLFIPNRARRILQRVLIASAKREKRGLNERAVFCSPANFFLLTNRISFAHQQKMECSQTISKLLMNGCDKRLVISFFSPLFYPNPTEKQSTPAVS